MDIFSTIHDSQDWDLISHSDGEYFEVSDTSSSLETDIEELRDFNKVTIGSSSDNSDSDETFIPNIKMFHISPLDNIQAQIDSVKS